jgi:GMP synthase (glutamine-hydrolysing)
MCSNKKRLKLLLLQIRDQPRVRREEHTSFCDYSGLHPSQLDIHNTFDKPDFGPEILQGYDGLIVGGASEASVLEPDQYPFVAASIALMRHCVEVDFPVFASCFGFQLAVLALGGTIVRDEDDFEMGTVAISLDPIAAADPFFCDVPDGFAAVSVHRERSAQCPPGATRLAFTSACCHAFKVDDRRFWAFQFHPEVDRDRLVERLTIFKHHYTDGDEHLEQVLANAAETPFSNALVGKFVDRVLLGSLEDGMREPG